MGDNARSIVSLIAILVVALLVAGLGFAFTEMQNQQQIRHRMNFQISTPH